MGTGIIVKAGDLAVNNSHKSHPPEGVHYSGEGTDNKTKQCIDNQCQEKVTNREGE